MDIFKYKAQDFNFFSSYFKSCMYQNVFWTKTYC